MLITNLLKIITQILERQHIPYMLSGSLALTLYAIPRATRDIDIIVELQDKHVNEFTEAIRGQFYFHEPTIKEEIKQHGMFNIIHLESSYKVDLFIRSDEPFEILKFRRRKQIDYSGLKIWVITLEDLLISKLIWIQQLESELQKRDIVSLLENPDADLTYIKNWCKELRLKTYNLINYE
jgi:hypothetical protein